VSSPSVCSTVCTSATSRSSSGSLAGEAAVRSRRVTFDPHPAWCWRRECATSAGHARTTPRGVRIARVDQVRILHFTPEMAASRRSTSSNEFRERTSACASSWPRFQFATTGGRRGDARARGAKFHFESFRHPSTAAPTLEFDGVRNALSSGDLFSATRCSAGLHLQRVVHGDARGAQLGSRRRTWPSTCVNSSRNWHLRGAARPRRARGGRRRSRWGRAPVLRRRQGLVEVHLSGLTRLYGDNSTSPSCHGFAAR